MEKILLKLAQKPGEYALGCTFVSHKEWDNRDSYDKKERKDKFNNAEHHAFTIKDIVLDDEGNIEEIILINPWYTSSEIHKTPDEFLDQVGYLSVVSEDDNYDEIMD